MRALLAAFALALPAGLAAAQSGEFPMYEAVVEGGFGAPMPSINMALVQGDLEVAADTTDAIGFAEFPAGETGEHTIVLQTPAPVDAMILAIGAGAEWSAEIVAGAEGPVIEFPAEAGELVQIWLVALDESYTPATPGEPVDQAAPPLEHTHGDATAQQSQQ